MVMRGERGLSIAVLKKLLCRHIELSKGVKQCRKSEAHRYRFSPSKVSSSFGQNVPDCTI